MIDRLARIGRSRRNLEEIGEELKARGITLRSLKDGVTLDDNAAGELQWAMWVAFSQYESDLISESTPRRPRGGAASTAGAASPPSPRQVRRARASTTCAS